MKGSTHTQAHTHTYTCIRTNTYTPSTHSAFPLTVSETCFTFGLVLVESELADPFFSFLILQDVSIVRTDVLSAVVSLETETVLRNAGNELCLVGYTEGSMVEKSTFVQRQLWSTRLHRTKGSQAASNRLLAHGSPLTPSSLPMSPSQTP